MNRKAAICIRTVRHRSIVSVDEFYFVTFVSSFITQFPLTTRYEIGANHVLHRLAYYTQLAFF